MARNEIANIEEARENRVARREERQGLQINAKEVRDLICSDATDTEIAYFIKFCENRGLNPFEKDAYLIKFKEQPAFIAISEEYYLKIANRNDKFDGFRQGIFVKTTEGKFVEREGEMIIEEETLLGGWAEVHRKDLSIPVIKKFPLSSWDKKQNQWTKMPEHMIAKTALKHALRAAFPEDSASYIDEGYEISEDDVTVDQETGEVIEEPREQLPDPEEVYKRDMLGRRRWLFGYMTKHKKIKDPEKIKQYISDVLQMDLEHVRDFIENDELYMTFRDYERENYDGESCDLFTESD